MLARLEIAYLGILRVVLLFAATAALLITIGATVSALPALGRMVGIGTQQMPRGASLRDFVAAKRLTDVEQAPSNGDESPEELAVPFGTDLTEASKNFARYDARNGGEQLTQKQWDDGFRSILDDGMPYTLRGAYGADVRKLSDQLVTSRGKPLSDSRLFELLQFHREQFLANAAAIEAENAGAIAASTSRLLLAGGAFIVFVLVLFNFIFVKIERNLRAARTDDDVEETG